MCYDDDILQYGLYREFFTIIYIFGGPIEL